MSRCVRINAELLNDRAAQQMPAAAFNAAFMAAATGQPSPLAQFVEPGPDRPPAHEWAVIRARIFARDDFACSYCGERGKRLECDHILPVARGGSHDDDNLTTACRDCNRSKRDKLVEDWLQ